MSTLKKFLCVVLSIALMTGVAALSATSIRAEAPVGAQAASRADSGPWWAGLPPWLQWTLRWIFFGWIWMEIPITEPVTTTTTTQTFNATWPENEFTMQVPKPEFEVSIGTITEDECAFLCGATISELRDYVSELKKAGFTRNADTTDTSIFGMTVYSYTANNGKGYCVEVAHAMGMSTISISRMM